MLILPSHYETRVLIPVPERQWRQSSQADPLRDEWGGHSDRTDFVVFARVHDGHIQWAGRFESRDDADAFLWAILRHQLCGDPMPRADWELPTPHWHPDIAPDAVYQLVSRVALASSGGSNVTYTSPYDWDNLQNAIETIGAGGSGGSAHNGHGTGGGGGAYNYIGKDTALGANFTFAQAGISTTTRRCGAAGTAVGDTLNNTNGVTGGDTWFGGTTLAGSSVGSKGGVRGVAGTGSQNGGAGGVAASGVGSGKDGGRGGNLTGASGNGGSGAGGAGGKAAAGSQGVDSSSTAVTSTNGGKGDGTAGGTAGVAPSGNGGAGAEWWSGVGSGGGGAGHGSSGTATGGTGGNYGSGGGGVGGAGGNQCTSGAGKIGLIVVSWAPRKRIDYRTVRLVNRGVVRGNY